MDRLGKTARRARDFLAESLSGRNIGARQVVGILTPIAVDQAFILCTGFLNTAMISSSGVNAVSAVSMVDSLNVFLVNVFVAVATGGTVVVAQYKGGGNDAMVPKAAAGALTSVFLLAVGIGAAVAALHGPMLGLLFGNADPDVLDKAGIYLVGSGLSYPGVAVTEAVCGALRGVGETRASLFLSLISNLSYVVLNFVFIAGLHMGVPGMVLALNLSRVLGAVCSLWYLVRINGAFSFHLRDAIRFDPSMLRRVFLIGLPFAAEQMFFNGGKILTQTFIVELGTYAIAVNAVGNSIIQLSEILGNAIILGAVTIVGQCVGSGDIADARKFIRSFLVLSSASFLVMAAVLLPLLHPLIGMFSPPPEIEPTIHLILAMTLLFQVPLWSVSFTTPAALRAGGDAKFTSVVSMLSMWLFRVVLGYVLGIHTPLGIVGVWLAMDCEWGVRAVVFLLRLKGDKWYRHTLTA